MADAKIDLIFGARGLGKTERDTKKLANAVVKVEKANQKTIATEKKAAREWEADEKRKQLATKRTQMQLEKLNRFEQSAIQERKMRNQRVFQSSAKIGGAGGSTLGAIGEGIGMGGGIGALGAAAGVAALGLTLFNMHIQKVAESMRRIDNAQKAYTDTLKSARSGQDAAAFGAIDDVSVKRAARHLTETQFQQFKTGLAFNIQGGQAGMAKAAKSGIAQQVGVGTLSSLFYRGSELGMSPDEVLANLESMGSRGRSRAMEKGSLRHRALGFGSDQEMHSALGRVGFSSDPLLQNIMRKQMSEMAGRQSGANLFMSGQPLRRMAEEQVLFWDEHRQAREALLKSADEEIKEKKRLAEASGALGDIFWRLIPFVESHQQELIRAKQDIQTALDRIESGGSPR